jgi:hypothetical protein
MSLMSGLALPMILRLYWWRFNASGMLIGTAVGLMAAVLQRIFYPDFGPQEKFFWITAISLVGTIVGTFLTKPTDPKVLENFYKTTKPFGIWGHLKRTLPPDERAAMTREHRNDLLSVPFIFGFQVTLFLLPMQAMIRTWTAFYVTLAIFLVSLFGVHRVWYRNLPPVREVPSTPLPTSCPACGAANHAEAGVCVQCGQGLPVASAVAAD